MQPNPNAHAEPAPRPSRRAPRQEPRPLGSRPATVLLGPGGGPAASNPAGGPAQAPGRPHSRQGAGFSPIRLRLAPLPAAGPGWGEVGWGEANGQPRRAPPTATARAPLPGHRRRLFVDAADEASPPASDITSPPATIGPG